MDEHSPSRLQACHAPAYGLHDGGRVLECTPELARMLGYGPPEALVGREALGFVAPECRDEAVQAALSELGKPLRTRGLRADGSSFAVEVRLFMVRDVSPVAVVVDDDPIVKNLIAALMRMVGYQTCAFQDPERVLPAFSPGLVSVMVTDIQMPGQDGVELSVELRKSDPDLPVIVMSGFSDVPEPRASGNTQFLRKPFGVDDLKAALQRLPERARKELD
jgi:CheY-like chemotaxis protein